MSWLTDLAGKAENILNKIDQNAATVLQLPGQKNGESEDVDQLIEIKCDSSGVENTEYTVQAFNPMKLNLRANKSETDFSSENGRLNGSSNRSSRRSSLSSRQDGSGTVIEKEIAINISINEGIKEPPVTIEKELALLKIVLAEIKSERDELKSENENLIENVKQNNNYSRITELENFCIKLEEDRNAALEQILLLEKSNSKYIKSISELETTISKLHQHEFELTQKLQYAITEKDQSLTELQQYRSRAQTNLQMKEKIIQDLKNGLNATTDKFEELKLTENLHQIEILRSENESLNAEILSLKSQLEQLKYHFTSNEQKYREISGHLEEKCEKMIENLKLEQKRNRQYDDEIKILIQELNSVRTEGSRLRSEMSKSVHDKEVEIQKLKTRLSQKVESSMANGIEERLQSLTQSLVQKQSALESLTAERNALKLQLEKVEVKFNLCFFFAWVTLYRGQMSN